MNLNNHAVRCHTLNNQVGNITQWVWPKTDDRTFNFIVDDWFTHIKPFILEHFKGDKTGSVIQAGGNCGVYPLLYTELFNVVYTFEPDPLSFFCLTNNCQFDNIIKFNAALGDRNGLIEVKEFHPDNRGMNRVEPTTDIARAIPIVAVDNFELQDVKLIQLDLEGYEIPAIKGALKTIKKYKPVMILECGDETNPDDVSHRTQLIDMMDSMGYSMHRSLGRLDIAFLPRNGGD